MNTGYAIKSMSLFWEGANGINLRWGGDISQAKRLASRESAERAKAHLATQVEGSRREALEMVRIPQHPTGLPSMKRIPLDEFNEMLGRADAVKYELGDPANSSTRRGTYVTVTIGLSTKVFFVGYAIDENQCIVEHVY